MTTKKILVLDTETASLVGGVYDIGFVVSDRKGTVYHEGNWLVREVITNPSKMMGAFFAKKLFSDYVPMLDSQTIRLKPWLEIVAELNDIVHGFGIETIAAYNLGFDSRVMGATHKELGNAGKVLHNKLNILDLWQFTCETKLANKNYRLAARANKWITDKGNIRTGAEFAYRYIFNQHDFIESHTALHDAQIETQIMAKCFDTKRKVPYGIMNQHPWRLVQESKKLEVAS